MGALFWITVVMSSADDSPGSFTIGWFSGSGRLEALLATPPVIALVASQAVLGVGLLKRRPWVRWFGPMYVIGGMLAGALGRFAPPDSWVTLALPLLAAVPTAILGWNRLRSSVSGRAAREMLP